MPKLLFFTCFAIIGSVVPVQAQHATRTAGESDNVVPGFVYVRLDRNAAVRPFGEKTGLPSLDRITARLGAREVRRAFPMLDSPLARQANSPAAAMLRHIYTVAFDPRHPPITAARQLMRNPHVLHAEPIRIRTITSEISNPQRTAQRRLVPNDPAYGSAYLEAVKMPDAWDVVRGDGDNKGKVIIAFVDGPTNWSHDDLAGTLWTNPHETDGNGVDDDNNGFPDDMHGWTFYNRSASLLGGGAPAHGDHGTLVTGVAAAHTDNGIGIAGTAWNAAKFIAVNAACSDDSRSTICYANEGVLYAAAHGAHIINASFAGSGTSAVEEAVYQAAFDMGSVVIASAGNAVFDVDFDRVYPASYPTVLGVGGTYNSGQQNQYAYGRSIHVYAPSENILVLDFSGDQVANYTGTSFSAPMVSGIAALVKTAFPGYNAGQLREQVRMTADNIDAFNPGIAPGLLGRGRVNAHRAVTESVHPGVRVEKVAWPDGGIVNGVPTQLPVTFKNWLGDADGLSVELKLHHLKFNDVRPDGSVTITSGAVSLGTLASGTSETANFTLQVDKLAYRFPVMLYTHHRASTASYDDTPDLIYFTANPPTILDHTAGNIEMSVTTDGNLGFLDYPWGRGKGMTVKSLVDGDGNPRQFLFEASLLVSRERMVDGNHVWDALDCVTGSGSGDFDYDFAPQNMDFATKPGTTPTMTMPGTDVLEHARIEMVDNPLEDYPIGLEIVQESFVHAGEANEDLVIVTYNVKNTASDRLEGIHVGLYFDWRMGPWDAADMPDVVGSDPGRRLGFQMDDEVNPAAYVGAMLLSTDTEFHYQQLRVNSDFHIGWMPQTIYRYMSSGVIPVDNPEPGNWAHVLGGGPYDIEVGSSVNIAFAVLAGASEEDLKRNADAAATLFDPSGTDPTAIQFVHNVPDAGPVDVYVSNSLAGDDVDFQTATSFLSMPAGDYTIDITGPTAPDNSSPVVSFEAEFEEGRHYMVSAAGLALPGAGEPEFTFILRDDVTLDEFGNAGTEGAFFVHGAPRLGAVDLEEIDQHGDVVRVFASGLTFGETTGKFMFASGAPVSVRITTTAGHADVFRFEIGPGPADMPVHMHLSGAGMQAAPGDPSELTVLAVLPDGGVIVPDVRTDAGASVQVPARFVLYGNHPNPFTEATRITFGLPAPARVTVEVFDLLGRSVYSAVDRAVEAGVRQSVIVLTATLASGTYVYRITARTGTTTFMESAQMTVVR